ncbi:MAG TPA: hypothetical protein VJ839_08150, partial [Candidatus Limnocylindria bacterium]|nr:hypothetical protein [Candidatus Limnocylindria bacterium]
TSFVRDFDSDEPAVVQLRNAVEAYDALASGRDSEAMRYFRKDDWGEGAFDNFVWSAHLAAWNRDDEALAEIFGGLVESGRHGPTRDALELNVQAARAARAGSVREAGTLYRQALDGWRALGMRFEEAMTGLDMAVLLDPADLDVQRAVQNSRVIFSELGAIPFLERLSAAVARSDPLAGAAPTEAVSMAQDEVPAGT